MARARTVERPTIPAPAKISIVLVVNGAERPLKVAPGTTLLDALRDHLDLTSTKKGCDHSQCGACTVLVDGRRINSCLTLAVMKGINNLASVNRASQAASRSRPQHRERPINSRSLNNSTIERELDRSCKT